MLVSVCLTCNYVAMRKQLYCFVHAVDDGAGEGSGAVSLIAFV